MPASHAGVEPVHLNALVDSRRWQVVTPRADDVVVTTAYKSGTTWMQAICTTLVHQSPEPPDALDVLSPWVEARQEPLDALAARLERMSHRRILKTHLPLDALPHDHATRYVYVARDPRDAWMSAWQHWRKLRAGVRDFPTPRAAFDVWTRRVFTDAHDGYPYWTQHHHARTWWPTRRDDNVLFVHFDDLLSDLDGQMRRVAAFLDTPVAAARWPTLVRAVTFDSMKRDAARRAPRAARNQTCDAAGFFHAGTNRRWVDVLTEAQRLGYEGAARRQLGPDLAAWLFDGALARPESTLTAV